MLDFTSSLYLGMRHPSRALRPWDQLTTGTPAALGPPQEASTVAAALAQLQGCERAIVARSTLHAFCDVLDVLTGPGTPVLSDAGSYPITQWGVERAMARGVRAGRFAHHDPDDLAHRLTRLSSTRPPVVVTDGLCPGCGAVAPLEAYLDQVRSHDGLLVIDDTQALGVLGHGPTAVQPYGSGGGGSLAWGGVRGPEVVVVGSLAKGFGVPIAAVAGSGEVIGRIEAEGPTRVHCSPPSLADLRGAEHALVSNAEQGDDLRARLIGVVRRLRRRLSQLGLVTTGGDFPVQILPPVEEAPARRLYRGLLLRGVRTVLQRSRCGGGASITFLLTARHQPAAIDQAAGAVARAVAAEERHQRATG